MKKYILLFLSYFQISLLSAQNDLYYFSHYQVENGLSNNAVLAIMQDNLGFMWFATRDGLNRFDGVSFKVFRNNPRDKYSIGNNAIMSLAEDNENKVWIGTEKGLFVFDKFTERFVQFKKADDVSIIAVKAVGDEIYYIGLYTLYCYNKKYKSLKAFLLNKEVTAYTILKNKNLLISTSSGEIIHFNREKNTFDKNFDVFSQSPKPVSKWIQSIYEVKDGLYLIGTLNQGLKLLNTNNNTYRDILSIKANHSEIIIRDVLRVSQDTCWIATESGIFVMDIKRNVISKLVKDYNNPYSLSDNIVHSLYLDHQGGIWAGTYFGGVNYLPKQEIVFKKYFHNPNSNSISGNAVSVIKNDKYDNLWIGTEDGGLNRYTPKTNFFNNYYPTGSNNRISYLNIHSLMIRSDSVWVGTYFHGLDLLNLNGEKLHNFNTENSALESNLIYDILSTTKGEIYVATEKGIYKYISSKKDFQIISLLPKIFFRVLVEDINGNIWAGSHGDGIYFFNTSVNFFKQYLFRYRIGSNVINYIFCDNNSQVWIATEEGLYKINLSDNKVKSFSIDEGMPSNIIYAMQKDKKENLWISSSRGLVRLNTIKNEITVYTKEHGLLTDQFNYRSAFTDKTGNMYFGTVKGMISFNPDSTAPNCYIPPIYITGFQINNNEVSVGSKNSPLSHSIIFTDKIVLPYNQNTISIDFACLDYRFPESIPYEYKLEGIDENWTKLSTNRKAFFTNLPPGNYSFLVRPLGLYNIYKKMQIKILPPFWKSVWAYIFYFILLISIIILIIKFLDEKSAIKNRYKFEKMKREKEKEHYEDKINFFMNVAHEIKTPLTLIKGPMENIMDRIEDAPNIKTSLLLMDKNTDRLMKLTNQLLDFRKIELNKFNLDLKHLNITTIAHQNYLTFKQIAKQKNIEPFTFNCTEMIYAYADEEALNKIFSNLIDNAVKYADKKVEIELLYSSDKKSYSAIFINDGFVIPEQKKDDIFRNFYRLEETAHQDGTGIGLTLSRSLAEMHGGSLQVGNLFQNLNTFILNLPINPKSFL